jgi:protein-disulfide isomerase
MTSRRRQKEEARARRIAEEARLAEKARRERRIRMVGGVVVAAVAVVAVLIAISSGGSSNNGLQTGTKAAQTTSAVESMLAGIPQFGQRLGSPNAPVSMIYYGDLQCPVCQAFTLSSFPQLVANEVRAGKVKVIYRAIETATHDQQTFQKQQIAALAAGAQNHFWDYVELFYHQQGTENSGYVNETFLDTLAKQIPGLNLNVWNSARRSPQFSQQLRSDAAASNVDGVAGTPTLIAQGPKGKSEAPGAIPDYAALQQAIKSVS